MIPPVFTWLPLPHLPQVPDYFVQDIVDRAKVATDPSSLVQAGFYTHEYQNRTINYQGNNTKSRRQESFDLSDDFHHWVKKNITNNYTECNGRINVAPEHGLTTHGAHVDNPGKIRLYYLLDQGGDSAETIFYLRPGDPVVYNMDAHNSTTPIHHNHLDELIVIDRAKFPLYQWVLFNGYTMHGVVNVTGPRLNLNISIRPDTFSFDIVTQKAV